MGKVSQVNCFSLDPPSQNKSHKLPVTIFEISELSLIPHLSLESRAQSKNEQEKQAFLALPLTLLLLSSE